MYFYFILNSMKKSGCFLILLLFILITWDAKSNPFALPFLQIEDKEDYNLEGYLFVLEDTQNRDLSWAFESYSKNAFQRMDHPYLFNKGFSKSIWWFALALENQLDQENILIFSPASSSLHEATLYTLDESGKIANTQISGYRVPNDIRDMDTRLVSFRISLAPKEKVILLLKTDSRGRNIYMPFFLDNAESYWEYEVNRAALFAGISTVLAFASLFALFLFIYLKERVYIIFLAYVLSGTLLILEEDGYAFDWLYGNWFLSLSQIGIPLFGLLTCGFLLKFNLLFTGLKTKNPTFFRTLRGFYYMALGWSLFLLLGIFLIQDYTLKYTFNLTALYLSMACVALVLVSNISQIHKKQGIYILLANLVLILGLTFYFLNSQGITSFNPIPPNGLVVGALVNVLAFTAAIGYRFYLVRKEKEGLLMEMTIKEKDFLLEKFRIQEEERQRIGRDLHDDLGALMAVIRLKVEDAENKVGGINQKIQENLAESVKLIEKATKDIRFIAHELMPSEVDQKRFEPMISELFAMMETQDRLDFRYHVSDLPPLPAYYKTNLFRIIKEMLNNTIKHAKGTEADIDIFYDNEDAEIKVILSDNGKGFDYTKMKEGNKGMGLKNLETRVTYLNGKHEISSGPLGTTVLVCIPFEINEYEQQ
jgi:signal transduction histidine kinase